MDSEKPPQPRVGDTDENGNTWNGSHWVDANGNVWNGSHWVRPAASVARRKAGPKKKQSKKKSRARR